MNHSSVVSVGIDVGKAKLDVACMQEDRTSIHQVFSNTEKGIGSLARFLKQQRTAVTGRPPRGCGGAARWCAETQRGSDMTKTKGRPSAIEPKALDGIFALERLTDL
jgi:hypothetical protein